LIDYPDKQVQRLGHDLMRQVKRMFLYWKRDQADQISRETFRRSISPVRQHIDAWLLHGEFSGNNRLQSELNLAPCNFNG
jgi:hypothetical protein